MITVKHKGSFRNTESFFRRASNLNEKYQGLLEFYAQKGVDALREATPVSSGTTAESWGYEIESGDGITTISFTNSNIQNGQNIAILLIYGHGTRNGGYVQGNDFVSTVIRDIFQQLANQIWMEVRG